MPEKAETFGAKLLRIRTEREMTRYALAKKCGLSQAGLSKLESGERQPAWDTVQKIALALGVGCSEFVDPSLALPEEQEAKPRGRPRKAADAPVAKPARKPRAKKGGGE